VPLRGRPGAHCVRFLRQQHRLRVERSHRFGSSIVTRSHRHHRGRVGLTAARFKPNPLRFGLAFGLRVDAIQIFGQRIGHAPVSRE